MPDADTPRARLEHLLAAAEARAERLERGLARVDWRLYEHIRYDHSQPWGACRIDSCNPDTARRHERERAALAPAMAFTDADNHRLQELAERIQMPGGLTPAEHVEHEALVQRWERAYWAAGPAGGVAGGPDAS